MKNIQIIDGADNATFSIFQASDEEFAAIFPQNRDMELIEDFTEEVLAHIWNRPILKRDAIGIHGTLFYDFENRHEFLPASKREVDLDPSFINLAKRQMFERKR
ncbi:hypothetical protein [Asticcacaulis benevestitus]|uniref:Uncharacterized protein n=1 Tax=Asticcacaulis benevestitus DSM 16100 = ATCC BAA-896 TaxID=1121022 RepID=V4P8V1_9CAUL|nr:hypothetical protein [Asticcacaulis benevestitus]ESQ81655.1 hypothetical protein ABENE_21645 [Asticcacaulis benevestitus DSM 16100 = ATCC BAA-896]